MLPFVTLDETLESITIISAVERAPFPDLQMQIREPADQ